MTVVFSLACIAILLCARSIVLFARVAAMPRKTLGEAVARLDVAAEGMAWSVGGALTAIAAALWAYLR